MRNIAIKIENKIAVRLDEKEIVCGNSNYTITFTFDEEWVKHDGKIARFTFLKNEKTKYIDVTFSGNSCKVPILSGIDKVSVGVYAGDLQTTTGAVIRCKKSILCGGQQADTTSPENNARMFDYFEQNYAPAIKGTVSGAADKIIIDDISPVEHIVPIKLSFSESLAGEKVIVRGENLAMLQQGSLYIESGEEAGRQDRVRTQYIPVIEGHTYYLSSEGNKWEIFDGIIYDKDYNYLRNGVYPDLTSSGLFEIPTGIGAAYLRLVLQPKKYPAAEYVPSTDGAILAYRPTDFPNENIVEAEWVKFTPFAEDATTSYSMMWDTNDLYIAIKTQDTSIDKGAFGSTAGQLGLFFNYADRLYFKSAALNEDEKEATPHAFCLFYYGDPTTNSFTLGRQFYGNAVTPVAQAGDNYKFVMSRDKNNYIQFFIKMNWKGFLGIENPIKKGYAVHFGAMYGNNTKRSYKTPYNGPTYTYSANIRHFLSDIDTNDTEIPEGVPTITPNYAWLMLNDGEMPTEYEPYVEAKTYYVNEDNSVSDVKSVYPTMVIQSEAAAEATMYCEYKKDPTRVIDKLTREIEELKQAINNK